MLSSIHPLGERGRRNTFATTATAFVIGSVIGGALTGLLLGSLGELIALGPSIGGERLRLAALLTAAVTALGFDLTGRALPSVKRQVNEDWLGEFRGWVYGAGFGLQLGAGVTTYITAAAVLLWLFSMIVVGTLPAAVMIGATFGFARGSSILFARSITSPERLIEFHRRLHRWVGRVRLVSRAMLFLLTLITAAMVATANP